MVPRSRSESAFVVLMQYCHGVMNVQHVTVITAIPCHGLMFATTLAQVDSSVDVLVVCVSGSNPLVWVLYTALAPFCWWMLQVKNFGRRGRTKHTHLVDQDTTVFDDDLAPERALQDAYFKRVAGVSQTFAKPKTLPINEKRHVAGKDRRASESANSKALYLKSNY